MKFSYSPKEAGVEFVRIHFSESDTTEYSRASGGERILSIGLGKKRSLITRRAFHLLIRRAVVEAQSKKVEKISIPVSELRFSRARLSPRALGEIVATEVMRAGYEFDRFKTKDTEKKKRIHEVLFIGASSAAFRLGVARGEIIGNEINGMRTLANTPGGLMTPALLAQAAKNVSAGLKIKVTILGPAELVKLKMGALLGVAKGSSEEPRFIVMEYWGASKKQAPIVLIGKGVTFDSGGLNLKPTGHMEDMYLDMSGGASVIHALVAAAKLKLKKNIIVLVPAAENMVSGSSYRPGDILTSMAGITIEIGNTDAEGRVILADALTYAKQYKPKLVVDVATLTGAAVVALGQRASALFSNRPQLLPKVQQIGEAAGEYVWPLPLWDEYEAEIKAVFGDVSNSGKTRYGGAITAAAFLHQFAREYPWVHIDMAPRMVSIEGEFLAKGSAGEPVGLLVKMLERM